MNLASTLVFYEVLGVVVAVAVLQANDLRTASRRWFEATLCLVFWPLFLPTLLRPASQSPPIGNAELECATMTAPPPPVDRLEQLIVRVEAELELALQNLDGFSDIDFQREQSRFAELRSACRTQAAKIRDLTDLLATLNANVAPDVATDPQSDVQFRGAESRPSNLDRLREIRDTLTSDLEQTLTQMRDLVTLIHLAKYTGAPTSRAAELVAEITASIPNRMINIAPGQDRHQPEA